MSIDPLLEIDDLAFARPRDEGGFELRLPGLRLEPGRRVAVVGASGCGKSTLLDLLGLILEPSRVGRFVFRPRPNEVIDIAGAPAVGRLDRFAQLRRGAIGYVLQEGGLLPFLSVLENIRLVDRAISRSAVAALAERLGIAHLLHKKPQRVSAGERQRVAIARAVVARPVLVLADEPTAALDPPTAERVMKLFVEQIEATGASLIVASHDWPLIARFGFERLSPHIEEGRHGACCVFV
jgi:putative ABC transport system ATP-binding protein